MFITSLSPWLGIEPVTVCFLNCNMNSFVLILNIWRYRSNALFRNFKILLFRGENKEMEIKVLNWFMKQVHAVTPSGSGVNFRSDFSVAQIAQKQNIYVLFYDLVIYRAWNKIIPHRLIKWSKFPVSYTRLHPLVRNNIWHLFLLKELDFYFIFVRNATLSCRAVKSSLILLFYVLL